MNLEEAKLKLSKYGQEQILRYYDELSDDEKAALLKQIDKTDMEVLSAIEHKSELVKKGEITPLGAMELDEIEADYDTFKNTGVEAIKAGKVGAILLAGGMGTRLGSDNPKGMYNVGVNRELYIFECLINNLMDVVKETGTYIHLFVMTSEKNNDATVSFFEEKDFFGYKSEYVHFFKQEMAPSVDYNGKLLMEAPDRLSLSPNGNGGWFISMVRAGLLDTIKELGVEWLNVFSVDNVLQKIADPIFVGAVLKHGCVCGSKVVAKADPYEKVGVLCLEDGRPSIVEYYEMTEEMIHLRDKQGKLLYNYGVILNYLFSVATLEKIMNENLPTHIVEKKIPYMDAEGKQIKPDKPNGYKFETLVLDMIHMMDNCLSFEVEREKEFAPIKNATGVDSLESARELMTKNGIEF